MSSRKRVKLNDNDAASQALLLQWLDESSESEEEEPESNSDSEIDNVEISEHDSNSEQEGQSDVEDVADSNTTSGNYYVGRDKKTIWRKEKPASNVRTRAHNIITHLPGPKGVARQAKSEIECLKLFMDNNIISLLTKYTNIYITHVRSKYTRDRDARLTDEIEIQALIGLLFLIGALRSSRQNVLQLWDNSKGNGLESCYLSMSAHRFQFLLRCLRMDDIHHREQRRLIDKLAPIRQIFELFVSSFQKHYAPSEYVTVDEQLLAFRGRCSFRQYIPSKPAKYGIKVFALVDSKTAYTSNLEVYCGKQPTGPYCVENSAKEIVFRLVKPIEGTCRNITGDNWFSSIPLVQALLKEKKLTYVGTLRKNKAEIPKEFLPGKEREINSSRFGFMEDCSMVSYCPKKNKCVLVISSLHMDGKIDPQTGEQQKPDMITFYNQTKVGVDLLDQLCANYNISRNCRRWPLVILYNLLNIACINASCIYSANNDYKKVVRRTFIGDIAWELIKPQIERRATIPQVPSELKRRARHLLGVQVEPVHQVEHRGSRGRCYLCGRSRNKSTRRFCLKCAQWICPEHSNDVCTSCINV